MSSYQPFYAFQINEDEECDEINEPLSSMTLGRRPFRVPQPSTMTLGAAVKIQTEVHIQPPSPVASSTTANVSESKYKTNEDDQDDKSPVKTRTPRISCKVWGHMSYRSILSLNRYDINYVNVAMVANCFKYYLMHQQTWYLQL